MSENKFLSDFSSSMLVLSREYNLPQLSLSDDYRCKLKYNNDFDLEIVGNPEGCLQLHAYIMPIYDTDASGKLLRELLEMNVSDIDLSGCYLGISKMANAVTLNSVMYMEKLDSSDLLTILHNFIKKANDKKLKIEHNFSAVMGEKDSSAPVTTKAHMPSDQHLFLNKFV